MKVTVGSAVVDMDAWEILGKLRSELISSGVSKQPAKFRETLDKMYVIVSEIERQRESNEGED